MAIKVTKKELEQALESYADLVNAYPNNEAYLQRYADMLQKMGRKATAISTLQHLHDVIAKRSPDEAAAFARKHPAIGRILLDNIAFETHDKHVVAGKIIHELLGSIWLGLHRKKIHEGKALCQMTDLHDSLILIIEGQVEVYAIDDDNNRILVEQINGPDVLGEHTFFKPDNIDVDAYISSETAVIVQVPRKKLLAMTTANQHLEKMLKQRAIFRTNLHALLCSPVFKALPLKLAKYLARKLILRQYHAGTFIHRLENPTQGIDLILAGQVCYLASNERKEKVMLPPLPKLSVTGDISLIGEDAPIMAELYAKSKAKLAHIPFNDILNVSMAFPPLKEQLMRHADAQQVSMMNAISR